MKMKRQAEKAIREIARKMGQDLAQEAIQFLGKLTQDEVEDFTRWKLYPGQPQFYRLAKALLVAIAQEDRITWQWSAEALKRDIRKARRIYRNRY